MNNNMGKWVVVFWFAFYFHNAESYELSYSTAAQQGMSANGLVQINDWARGYVDEGKLAGIATLIARDGEIVHFEAAGMAGSDDRIPLTRDALFRIYSMSKPITSVAVMALIEDEQLSIDDPVATYFPELAKLEVLVEAGRVPARSTMTVRNLLTHTAGFSYGFNPRDPIDQLYRRINPLSATTMDEFVTRLATLPLKFEPGSRWHYSVAADVLGVLVERVSGKSFDVFLRERIFEPLEMVDTFFNVPADKESRFLPNHWWDRGNKRLVMFRRGSPEEYRNTRFFSGGGGLVSTTTDYFRFAEMLRSGGVLGVRILKQETVDLMTRDHLPDSIRSVGTGESPLGASGRRRRGFGFGLGFSVVTEEAAARGAGSAGEYSWGGAAGTIFWIDPVQKLVVIGMIQLMGSPWPFRSELKRLTSEALVEKY